LCGSQDNLQRQQVKQMLREWEKKFPGRVDSIFRSIQNIAPSHMMDRGLFDFNNVIATGSADATGDKAFDVEEFADQFVEPTSAQVIKFR
jgi:tRNA 2-thiocytidine biosynthesis protein TtcA